MATKTETKRPWLSGFCNPSVPRQGHSRCRMFTDTGTPCSCTCHTVPEAEPQVWEGDNA